MVIREYGTGNTRHLVFFQGSCEPWQEFHPAMFLCFGNAFVFGGLLRTLPDEKTFDAFARRLKIS